MNTSTENHTQRKKLKIRTRDAVAGGIYMLLLAGLAAGIIWNSHLYSRGTLAKQIFQRRMLFAGLCAVMMASVFLVELLLRIRLPLSMEIVYMTFAFLAMACSTVFDFYGLMPFWDTIMHTMSGVIFSMAGLSLAYFIFRERLEGKFRTVMFLVFALFFALVVGYLWELFEFTGDCIFTKGNLQCYRNDLVEDLGNGTYIKNSLRGSGLIDTITDMFVNFAGAIAFFFVMLVLSLKKPAAMELFRPQIYPWWKQAAKNRREKESAQPSEEEN